MKIVLEMTLNQVGEISAILDQHAPNARITADWDELFLKLNNLPHYPMKVLSLDTTKK